MTAPYRSVDDGAPEPAQATVRVRPCEGCGGLPHGPVTATIDCLRAALTRERAVTAPLRRALAAAQAEARELRWEMTYGPKRGGRWEIL